MPRFLCANDHDSDSSDACAVCGAPVGLVPETVLERARALSGALLLKEAEALVVAELRAQEPISADTAEFWQGWAALPEDHPELIHRAPTTSLQQLAGVVALRHGSTASDARWAARTALEADPLLAREAALALTTWWARAETAVDPDPRFAELTASLLDHPVAGLHAAVACALGGERSEAVLAKLREGLRSEDLDVRADCALALPDAEVLASFITDEDRDRRRRVIGALTREPGEEVARLLESASPVLRSELLRLLALSDGSFPPALVTAVLETLLDPTTVAFEATGVLRARGWPAWPEEVQDAIVAWCRENGPQVPARALRELRGWATATGAPALALEALSGEAAGRPDDLPGQPLPSVPSYVAFARALASMPLAEALEQHGLDAQTWSACAAEWLALFARKPEVAFEVAKRLR